MTRPDDVSAEAWEDALSCVDMYLRDVCMSPQEAIARTIQSSVEAERGACAAIATNFATTSNTRDINLIMQEAAAADTAEGIARAIRSRKGS